MPAVQCRASAAANKAAHAPARIASSASLLRRFNLKFTGLDLPAPHERKRKHEQHRANCCEQKWQAHILFEEERNADSHAGGETTCHSSFCLGRLQEPEGNENPECALAVVFGNRNDAVDAENSNRRCHKQRDRPCCANRPARRHDINTFAERRESDSPGEHGAQPAHHCGIDHMMKEDAAGEVDDGRLKEKSKRRMDKRKVAIGHLPGCDARRAVEHVARVPQNRHVRVLPKHDARRSSEEADCGGQISECKAGRQLVGLGGSTPVSTIRGDSSSSRRDKARNGAHNTAHNPASKRSP